MKYAVAVALGLGAMVGHRLDVPTVPTNPVPICEEDQVLTGIGSFEHGRWTMYACSNAVTKESFVN